MGSGDQFTMWYAATQRLPVSWLAKVGEVILPYCGQLGSSPSDEVRRLVIWLIATISEVFSKHKQFSPVFLSQVPHMSVVEEHAP